MRTDANGKFVGEPEYCPDPSDKQAFDRWSRNLSSPDAKDGSGIELRSWETKNFPPARSNVRKTRCPCLSCAVMRL